MGLDVARVRGLYPTLGAGVAYLDGSYGALQPESVIRAVITTLRASPAQPGSRSARSERSAAAVDRARTAIADLVGAVAADVLLGGNLSVLLQHMALVLSREWRPDDEVVLTRAGHNSNLRPWLQAADSRGVTVRWAEIDVETGELPEWQFEQLISRRTRVVALSLGNQATGTVPDVRKIADLAHERGAVVVVDGGAALPYIPIDLEELGADLFGVAASTFGGPTMGALAARPGLLSEIADGGRDDVGPIPQRYEVGAMPVELVEGLVAAVDHLAGLDEQADGSRRERLRASLREVDAHACRLFADLEPRLRALPGVAVLGTAERRLPVAAFAVEGHSPAKVGQFLARKRVSVWTGDGGLGQLMSAFGADELGGAVFVGVMPHNTTLEVDRLIGALGELLA